MITLSNERGLITSPNSWDEIETIPGYVKGLDPSKHKLKAIIGSYQLKDIHCGLSECNHLHDKGYIAQTISGAITNIGHVCGKKYFGVDFTTFANKHKRDVEEQFNRQLLSSFNSQLHDLEIYIAELRARPYGADWIYKTSQSLVTRGKGCPDEVVRKVLSMVKSQSNKLEKDRLATEDEIKSLEISKNTTINKPHYITEQLAVISGLDVLHHEYDLKSLLIVNIDEQVKKFKKLEIDQLGYSDLTVWAKWVNSIENSKEKIDFSMNAGLSLLRQPNLKPLVQIITNRDEISEFKKFLKKLPS